MSAAAQGAASEEGAAASDSGSGVLEPLPSFPDPDFPAEIREIMRKLRFSRQEVRRNPRGFGLR